MVNKPRFLLVSLILAISQTAFAQAPQSSVAKDFPARPIRIIVTTSPGSGLDILARAISVGMSDLYKQQVIVDNRPGAGGLIGAGQLAAAAPDGYTLGIAATAHIVAPLLQATPPYRPLEDFTPIAQLTSIPNLVVGSAKSDIKSFKDLIEKARANPGKLNYGSLGDGTASHFAAEIVNRAAKIDVTHIPFKVIADSYTALWNGELQYVAYLMPSGLPLLQGGKGVALAVTSRQRSPALPDVPTVGELGYPAAQSEITVGILAPANLPPPLVARLHQDIVNVMRRPEIRDRFLNQGGVPMVNASSQDYALAMKSDYETYQRLIVTVGLKPQ